LICVKQVRRDCGDGLRNACSAATADVVYLGIQASVFRGKGIQGLIPLW
jgi:hypothetical protein